MAESKKKPEPKKTIIDVTHPDEVKPSDTSKPVIVGHKPLLKDPMVVEDDGQAADQPAKPITKTGEIKIKPLSETDKPEDKPEKEEKPSDDKKTIAELAAEADAKEAEEGTGGKAPEPAAEPKLEEPEPAPEEKPEEDKPEPAPDPVEDKPAEDKPAEGDKQAADPDAELKKKEDEQAKHDAEIQELADSKKFYLPINQVEKRRSKRVAIAGVLLSLILALAWVDVALDAGLIELGGVKPVTHFFSN